MNDITRQEVEFFFSQFRKISYRKGAMIVAADEDPSGVFYLKKGSVRVTTISSKGDEVVLNIFKPHAFFPMDWAINQTKNWYAYQAIEDVELCLAPREKVVAYVKEHPDILFDLLARVYRGIDGILVRMEHLMAANAYQRLITELIIMAKRFGESQPDGTTVIHITDESLSAQTGLTRETISRKMHELKKDALVKRSSKTIVIQDLQKLESCLCM